MRAKSESRVARAGTECVAFNPIFIAWWWWCLHLSTEIYFHDDGEKKTYFLFIPKLKVKIILRFRFYFIFHFLEEEEEVEDDFKDEKEIFSVRHRRLEELIRSKGFTFRNIFENDIEWQGLWKFFIFFSFLLFASHFDVVHSDGGKNKKNMSDEEMWGWAPQQLKKHTRWNRELNSIMRK
jgi:hypothetical protein